MNIRIYKWIAGLLVCFGLWFAWRCLVLRRQAVVAALISGQCEITQTQFVDLQAGPEGLAGRLEFLSGYYRGWSKVIEGTPLARVVERDYYQTLGNSVAAFRRWTTNDLGDDVAVWIKAYQPKQ